MAEYRLTKIDDNLWMRVKIKMLKVERETGEKLTIKKVVVRLLNNWVNDKEEG